MSDIFPPSADRGPDGRFLPGHSGGRPFGSRNRVSRKLLLEMHRDFEAHKAELLDRLYSAYSPDYFNALARMIALMTQVDVSKLENGSDAAAARSVVRPRRRKR